jgi:hypothetical protein
LLFPERITPSILIFAKLEFTGLREATFEKEYSMADTKELVFSVTGMT